MDGEGLARRTTELQGTYNKLFESCNDVSGDGFARHFRFPLRESPCDMDQRR